MGMLLGACQDAFFCACAAWECGHALRHAFRHVLRHALRRALRHLPDAGPCVRSTRRLCTLSEMHRERAIDAATV